VNRMVVLAKGETFFFTASASSASSPSVWKL
jgi:hypothetical protein